MERDTPAITITNTQEQMPLRVSVMQRKALRVTWRKFCG
jgi:hypothetical protein